jgi:hypothetical protein
MGQNGMEQRNMGMKMRYLLITVSAILFSTATLAGLVTVNKMSSESTTASLINFSFIALASAFFWNKKEELAKKANIKATITTVILFQAVGFMHLGHLDPIFPIVMVITGVIAFITSAVVGKLYR